MLKHMDIWVSAAPFPASRSSWPANVAPPRPAGSAMPSPLCDNSPWTLEAVPAAGAGEEDDEASGDGGGAGAVAPVASQVVVVLDV
jgi:hypothetical protein